MEGSCLFKDDNSRTNSGKAHNVDEGHSKRKTMGTQISKKTKFANELSYYLEFLIFQPDHNGGFLRLWLVGCHCLCLWLFFAAKSGPKLGLTHKQRQCTRIVTDLPQIWFLHTFSIICVLHLSLFGCSALSSVTVHADFSSPLEFKFQWINCKVCRDFFYGPRSKRKSLKS